jgi:hypothetical protein
MCTDKSKMRLTMRSQHGTQKLPEMRLFLGKSALFTRPLSRPQAVLWWKMIARHHSKVQPTWGTRRVIMTFFWLGVFPVSTGSPRSHPKRLTRTVGQTDCKERLFKNEVLSHRQIGETIEKTETCFQSG